MGFYKLTASTGVTTNILTLIFNKEKSQEYHNEVLETNLTLLHDEVKKFSKGVIFSFGLNFLPGRPTISLGYIHTISRSLRLNCFGVRRLVVKSRGTLFGIMNQLLKKSDMDNHGLRY